MGDCLKRLKEKSIKRRKLLAKQLGAGSVDRIGEVLGSDETKDRSGLKDRSFEVARVDTEKQKCLPEEPTGSPSYGEIQKRMDIEDEEYYGSYEMPEETYQDSSTFLKGTQSANPHNDYCQHFVDTGQRPQNFIRDVGLADRFEEYPKLRELIRLKDDLIAKTATAPMYLKCDLETFDVRELGCKFDVILLEPPLEEYQRTGGATNMKFWNWEHIMNLEVEEIAAQRSFVFMWCGSSEGLDWGRQEHCLMGIKGTVRRSTDGDFIHANVDIDLIIAEEPEYGSIEKPVEIFHIIEHFCLGRRRLHMFGRDSTIRPGWLTIGPQLTNSNFNSETYKSYFDQGVNDFLTGCTERIEALRPKSPPPKMKMGSGPGGGNRGGITRGGTSNRGRGGQSRGGFSGRGRTAHRGR